MFLKYASAYDFAGSIPMQQFIPFEDEWDMLETLRPEDLIPYRAGMLDSRPSDQRTGPISPSIFSSSPGCTPIRRAVPPESSST